MNYQFARAQKLERASMEVVAPALTVNWVPDRNELQKCFEFGRAFARKVKETK